MNVQVVISFVEELFGNLSFKLVFLNIFLCSPQIKNNFHLNKFEINNFKIFTFLQYLLDLQILPVLVKIIKHLLE